MINQIKRCNSQAYHLILLGRDGEFNIGWLIDQPVLNILKRNAHQFQREIWWVWKLHEEIIWHWLNQQYVVNQFLFIVTFCSVHIVTFSLCSRSLRTSRSITGVTNRVPVHYSALRSLGGIRGHGLWTWVTWLYLTINEVPTRRILYRCDSWRSPTTWMVPDGPKLL